MTNEYITEYTEETSPNATDAILLDQGGGAYKYLKLSNLIAPAAADLTGTTLASNVVNSSLTSVGTLTSLTSSGGISGTTGAFSGGISATTGAFSGASVPVYGINATYNGDDSRYDLDLSSSTSPLIYNGMFSVKGSLFIQSSADSTRTIRILDKSVGSYGIYKMTIYVTLLHQSAGVLNYTEISYPIFRRAEDATPYAVFGTKEYEYSTQFTGVNYLVAVIDNMSSSSDYFQFDIGLTSTAGGTATNPAYTVRYKLELLSATL